MSWQKDAEAAAASAYRITYADAIAEGLDESEARELAEDAAQDTWYAAGEYDDGSPRARALTGVATDLTALRARARGRSGHDEDAIG